MNSASIVRVSLGVVTLLTLSPASAPALFAQAARASGAAIARSTADSVDAFVRREMKSRRIPGAQLAVVRHGAIVYRKEYGFSSLQDSTPVSPRNAFMINSITKAFVGVAIMQLVEEGKVDLDAPISTYLDSLPESWRAVKVTQMLSHVSGLPDVFEDYDKMNTDSGSAQAWRRVLTRPMDFTPQTKFAYNQTGYVLLGKIIEKVSGMHFTKFITERQLRVVGMPVTAAAGFTDSRDIIAHASRVYSGLAPDRPLTNVVEVHPLWLRTALGMSSTAQEMATWLIAIQQGKLLKKQGSVSTMWTPARLTDGTTGGFTKLVNGYALGFPAVVRSEHPAIAALGGARSVFFVYPEDDLTVVLLTNLQGSFPETMIDGIAKYFFDARSSAPQH